VAGHRAARAPERDQLTADKPASATGHEVAAAVIGAGQSGLATAFYLRRAGLTPGKDFVVLDAAKTPGGAWTRMWPGLRLFSPASFSSLPGWMMPAWNDAELGYPPRDHVVEYLTAYEQRYGLAVLRPFPVESVARADADPHGPLLVGAGELLVAARAVISTTGSWDRPFWPSYPGMGAFAGRQLHAADYVTPEEFAGRRVVVVGGGNSAAQILAEVSTVADTTWVTARPPRFLPDDVDGRALFATARARIQALERGGDHAGVAGLGDIVMVPSVREARARGALEARPMFARLTTDGVQWSDGTTQDVDAVIWCTGFRPALRHLRPLALRAERGHGAVGGRSGTQSLAEPRLFLVGYGDWTGPASATLIGVGRPAREAAAEIAALLA
jgi:cation diffusion facilitator CzcD-associated flavoprotein CzcO